MSSPGHVPDAAKTASEQPLPQFIDLDGIVLTHILARLHDPLPLALTCKTLLHALDSQPCRQEWFDRWHHVYRRDDPVALAVLSWKPLAGYDVEQLSSFMVNTVRHSITLREQYTEPLKQSLEVSRSRQWLGLYKLFVPWPEHLLLLATAASPHSNLLTELLRSESERYSSSISSATGVSPTAASVPPGSATVGDPVQQLTHSTASSHTQQSPAEDGQQQRHKAFVRPVPKSFHLPAQVHDQLQSALLSAAAAGQRECLQLLLDQWLLSLVKHSNDWEPIGPQQPHFMVGLVETAAAAGDRCCLDTALLGVAAGARAHRLIESTTSHQSPVHQQQLQQQDDVQIIANTRQQLYEWDYQAVAAQSIQIHSKFCLVAAAGSGSCTVVSDILSLLSRNHIKQQLPAALTAAGRRDHLEVLQLLLKLQEVSSKPLEMAATDAAVYPWPLTSLDYLLKHMAKHYRIELLQLLHKPLLKALQSSSVTQQPQQLAAVAAILGCIKSEAVTEAPELLGDVLLLLAQQGDAANVSWVLKVAPTVLVKLGPAAVTAALEGGHPQVAQIILDAAAGAGIDLFSTQGQTRGHTVIQAKLPDGTRGFTMGRGQRINPAAAASGSSAPGERPAAFKAAAKRGELVAAVRNKDVTAVRGLLEECSLPPETSSLLNILKTAAAAGAPESVLLLQLLAPAVPSDCLLSSRSAGMPHGVTGLIEFCLAEGLVQELKTVFRLCARSVTHRNPYARARIFRGIASFRLPDDDCYVVQRDSDNSCAGAQAVPGHIAAAIALMQLSGGTDLLSLYVAHMHPLLDTMLPYSGSAPDHYLGVSVRPTFPGQLMPCKKGSRLLLQELTKLAKLPASAKVKVVGLYKLMVQVILESADVMLLHAFLKFMEAHGSSMLANVVEKLKIEQDEQFATNNYLA